jgi:hypothetical protein
MILGSVFKYAFNNAYIWVVIDLLVLLVCYLMLKRQPFIDLKHSMVFLGGLTVVSILVDLNIISGLISNLALLALVLWLFFGRRFSAPRARYYPPVRRKPHK